jgi:hypothetical protein
MQTAPPHNAALPIDIDMNHIQSKKERLKAFASTGDMRYNADHSGSERVEKPLMAPSELTPYLKRPMPVGYFPSPHSVLTGRGKFCTEATGSKRLRVIASEFLYQYSKAETKQTKSDVVSKIIEIIEKNCRSGGAFVKLEKGRWWEVDKSAAREKVGYILRNLLHDKYRSSSKSKAKTRRLRLSRESQNKKNALVDADDAFSQSSSDSTAKHPITNVALQHLKKGDYFEELSTNRRTDESEDITNPAARSLYGQGYNAAAGFHNSAKRFPGNGSTLPGVPLSAGAMSGVVNFSPSLMSSSAPPLTTFPRAQTWPLGAQNLPSTPAALQFQPLAQTSQMLPQRPSLRHGAQTALGPISTGQSWQPPPFPPSTDANSMGNYLLEEVLEVVNCGDSTPIDENELSNIFD